ncbi:hypothetical protein Tco_0472231 [Tanacetum coccineum]
MSVRELLLQEKLHKALQAVYDDDDEESTIPLNEIISQIPSSIAITPVLLTMEPEDSLNIGDKALSTIPEKESNEVIKSSFEDLVPIPSESIRHGDKSLPEEDVDIESKGSYVSNLDEAALLVTPLSDANEDECFDPGGDIDEIKACLTSDSITQGIDGANFDSEGDIILLEKLLNDDPSSPLPPKEPYFKDLKVIKSFIDTTSDSEDDYYDSEGDIIYLESLLIKDTIPNILPEVFLDNNPTSLNGEPDNDDLKSMVKVFDPGIHEKIISPTYVRLPFENRHYFSLTFVIRTFLPYLTYSVDSSLLLSSGSEDTIFDPDISAFHFSSIKPVASHRSGTFMYFNVYPNNLNESLMEICSSTCFVPNITMIWGESR